MENQLVRLSRLAAAVSVLSLSLICKTAFALATSLDRYVAIQQSSASSLEAFDRGLLKPSNRARSSSLFQNPLYITLMAHKVLLDAEVESLSAGLGDSERVELAARLAQVDEDTLNRPGSAASHSAVTQQVAREISLEVARLKGEMIDQDEASTQRLARRVGASAGAGGQITGREFPQGHWSLTFDDGPQSRGTTAIAQSLGQAGLAATFFWLSPAVQSLVALAGRALQSGNEVAVHTIRHPVLTRLNSARLRDEVLGAQASIESSLGFRPRLFRCPYGACGKAGGAVRQMIASGGMVSILWNVDSLDWRDKNPSRIVQRVRAQMTQQQRGIILFHDIQPGTPSASAQIMDELNQQRQVVRTVGQMIDQVNRP